MSNFFSPPAHLCAVTYMTVISLIVTLNNQFTIHFTYKQVNTSSQELTHNRVMFETQKFGIRQIKEIGLNSRTHASWTGSGVRLG